LTRVPGRPRSAPKPAARFVAEGSPEWIAHEAAMGRKLTVTMYLNGDGGRMMRPSELEGRAA
jgi:hypothetical protein